LKKVENQLKYEYCGVLQEHISAFVIMKRAVGYKYNTEAALLRRFDVFTLDFSIPQDRLPKDVVLAWSQKRPYFSVSSKT
jgi:hypothetical protein